MNALDTIETVEANGPRGRYGEAVQRVIRTIREFTTVSEVLRILGALAMVSSISVFVLQGWADGNDVQRYFKLLAQTGLLAAGGLLLACVLNENKGARLFFGLGLVAVPANFAILGALFYSALGPDLSGPPYPTYALWSTADPAIIGWVTAGAAAALLPITHLAFRIFSRPNAARLTLGFTVINALMLVPMRSAGVTGMLAAAAVFGALAVFRTLDREQAASRTPGARFAALMLLVPAAVITGRGLFLYQFDELLGFVLALTGYIGLRQVAQRLDGANALRGFLELAALPVSWTVAFWGSAFFASFGALPSVATEEFVLAVFAAIVAAGMVDIGRRASSSVARKSALWFSSLLINLAMVLNVLFVDSVLATAIAVVASATLSAYGYRAKSRFVFASGVVTAVLCALFGMRDVFELLLDSGWLGLGLGGAAAIIVASLVERHGATIKLRLSGANGLFAKKPAGE